MSFSVRLTPDLIAVEAGATAPLTILVSNKNGQPERFEMQVEGLDPEWVATPEPIFTVDPAEEHQERIFFKPPRVSESLSGNYPFVLRIRSLESGEARTVQGVLQIKPYNHLSMEIAPKKGYISATRKNNSFGVTIMNLGNTEHTLQLYGNDPEDACAFSFEQEQVTLGPGQTKTIETVVEPTSSPRMGNSRLHGFSVSARSLTAPAVVATAQGQLEQRPLLTPGTIAFIVVFLVIAGLWFAFLPKTPTLDLTVSPLEVTAGDEVSIAWTSHDSNRVVLKVNGVTRPESDPIGQIDLKADQEGSLMIEATPYRDNKSGTQKTRTVLVSQKTIAPKPTVKMWADKADVPLGQSVVINYEISDAISAKLTTTNEDLSLVANQIEKIPTSLGKKTYTIVATNKDGVSTKAQVTVNVVQKRDVNIVAFEATPKTLPPDGGMVHLDWQFTGAVRVTLQQDGDPAVQKDITTGTADILVTKNTLFTITGYDSNGLTVSKKVRIEVQKRPDTPPDSTDAGTPPATNSNAGGTTNTGTTAGG